MSLTVQASEFAEYTRANRSPAGRPGPSVPSAWTARHHAHTHATPSHRTRPGNSPSGQAKSGVRTVEAASHVQCQNGGAANNYQYTDGTDTLGIPAMGTGWPGMKFKHSGTIGVGARCIREFAKKADNGLDGIERRGGESFHRLPGSFGNGIDPRKTSQLHGFIRCTSVVFGAHSRRSVAPRLGQNWGRYAGSSMTEIFLVGCQRVVVHCGS